MNQRLYRCSLAAVVAILALSSSAFAQASTATFGGIVIDETGAAVPDVHVAVINLGTGVQRATAAGAQGRFVMPLLLSGLPPDRTA